MADAADTTSGRFFRPQEPGSVRYGTIRIGTTRGTRLGAEVTRSQ